MSCRARCCGPALLRTYCVRTDGRTDRQLGKAAEHTPGPQGCSLALGCSRRQVSVSFYLEFAPTAAKLRTVFEATRSYAFGCLWHRPRGRGAHPLTPRDRRQPRLKDGVTRSGEGRGTYGGGRDWPSPAYGLQGNCQCPSLRGGGGLGWLWARPRAAPAGASTVAGPTPTGSRSTSGLRAAFRCGPCSSPRSPSEPPPPPPPALLPAPLFSERALAGTGGRAASASQMGRPCASEALGPHPAPHPLTSDL